jgi:hypothetical protein
VSNPCHTLRSLLHRLGVVGPARLRAFQGISASAALLAAALLAIPATASASATLEGPPQFSSAPGLSDGREYVQVSPADKNGNEAGGNTTPQKTGAVNHYGLASADGNAVLFEGTGPIGKSPSGNNKWFVAEKKAGEPGWSTRSLLPASNEHIAALNNGLELLDPAADLSHAMVEPEGQFLHGAAGGCHVDAAGGLYLTGPDPFDAATWLERPEIEDPVESCDRFASVAVGGTPDFSTVYFAYVGTLLPQDESRASHFEEEQVAPHPGSAVDYGAWGFYENREGVLREAGVLPDEEVSEWGAVPAASGHGRNRSGNQVSADGSRAFFVSPDPAAVGSCKAAEEGRGASAAQAAAACAPQLYVRENGDRTVLVSRDTLLPEAGGLPVSAPGGVLQMPNPTFEYKCQCGFSGSYVFASSDGSQAFFQSADALTQAAEEASPGAEPKMYDFDVDTGALTYLPGVVGEIVATDSDGSSFAFVRPEAGSHAAELDLWNAGPEGGSGSVTPVTQLPGPPSSGGGQAPVEYVSEARMSSDGTVLVFQTASRLSSAFNSGGDEEIYRYDVPANTLGCVSCAPAGIMPRGAASMSILNTAELGFGTAGLELPGGIVDERGISADGDRIFFDSPDPLVPQDSNTSSPPLSVGDGNFVTQGDDVYEWENGVVYLISTGKSPLNSYLLDSSENGNDVFFATAEGLVPGDTDGGFDIYDARIPHEGEPYSPAAVPCEGSVCQGPPNVPAPLTPPASATFTGLGNPTPEVTPPPVKTVTKKTVKCKKGFTKKKNKCVRTKTKKKAKKASTDRRTK